MRRQPGCQPVGGCWDVCKQLYLYDTKCTSRLFQFSNASNSNAIRNLCSARARAHGRSRTSARTVAVATDTLSPFDTHITISEDTPLIFLWGVVSPEYFAVKECSDCPGYILTAVESVCMADTPLDRDACTYTACYCEENVHQVSMPVSYSRVFNQHWPLEKSATGSASHSMQ